MSDLFTVKFALSTSDRIHTSYMRFINQRACNIDRVEFLHVCFFRWFGRDEKVDAMFARTKKTLVV